MAVAYRVRTGDCISSIAAEHNLLWEFVWNHPDNAELREKRGDPNILKEGDIVHVPSPKPKECEVETGKLHRFKVTTEKTHLKLRIVQEPKPKSKPQEPVAPTAGLKNVTSEDPEPDATLLKDEPRADVAYRLKIDGSTFEGKTSSDGVLECDIPPHVKTGWLILEPGTPNETSLALNLGHLDPIDEVSGVKQRLANLTFDCGSGDGETPELEAALRLFQQKNGLKVTGKIDQATKDELAKLHDGKG